MILIGQFDSPFVRRVGIALRLSAMSFEHRPWSTFGDADSLGAYNPLRRVPTLVLDDGEVLIESGAILDHLDQTVGPARAMLPAAGSDRRHALQVIALGTGLAEKAVSLVYERVLHQQTSDLWIARCRTQIAGVLDALETRRKAVDGRYWAGDSIGHADIMVACALRFLTEAHPGLFEPARCPALADHAAMCEALDPFPAIAQPFIPPS